MKNKWDNDFELFNLMKEKLYSAIIGDVMDQGGYFDQFLPPSIHPLDDEMIVAGRAMTVLETDIPLEASNAGEDRNLKVPFGLMFKALDDLKENEVYICTGASPRYALWGELMSTRAKKLGAAGAVLHGFTRDSKGILSLGFPTFSIGKYAQDQGPRGMVIDFRMEIDIEGIRIGPGDIVFGDADGVCIIPRQIEEEVIHRAFEKVDGENEVRKAIETGMSAGDAFEKYGIM
ncbi:MAG: RraA family protein [Cyclobacteriaceae bacterium]|nr:RraA family protein [Cyclobacteriaceae bacterium]